MKTEKEKETLKEKALDLLHNSTALFGHEGCSMHDLKDAMDHIKECEEEDERQQKKGKLFSSFDIKVTRFITKQVKTLTEFSDDEKKIYFDHCSNVWAAVKYVFDCAHNSVVDCAHNWDVKLDIKFDIVAAKHYFEQCFSLFSNLVFNYKPKPYDIVRNPIDFIDTAFEKYLDGVHGVYSFWFSTLIYLGRCYINYLYTIDQQQSIVERYNFRIENDCVSKDPAWI